ncbi:MAG: alpha/beta hydrolase [Actinobacteria bacterium]|nr:alpha/beta hydrolase [Actinomycetota bacterium]
MSTFVLVHGAWHGAWCWERLTPELAQRGHVSIVMDLPCEDPEAGLEEYADAVIRAAADVAGPVILVGHSLGCLTIPLIPERRPVERMVFLCGPVPEPGISYTEWSAEQGFRVPSTPSAAMGEDLTSSWADVDDARSAMYHDCPPEDAWWAFTRLRRQAAKPTLQAHPMQAWPDVPFSCILAREDRLLDPAWARRDSAERLGAPAIEIDGSHSPFLAQPSLLAGILDDLAS